MLTILLIPLKNNTRYTFIGEEKNTVALLQIVIMTRNMSMYQCLLILKKPFASSNTQHLRDLNMPHMTELPQRMAQESNNSRQNQTYQP